MSSTFAELGAPADLVDHLATRGILTAFDIQSQALPPALAGRDICGRAPTGSGKTLAFGIPIAQRVHKAKPRRPKALILAPTRELATQISDELKPLLKLRGRTIATFFGGVSFGPQMSALHRGVDVAVACPGRLADLVRRNAISLDDVEIVVVDEADRMADMGFLPEVRKILDQARSGSPDAVVLGHARQRRRRPRAQLPAQSGSVRGRPADEGRGSQRAPLRRCQARLGCSSSSISSSSTVRRWSSAGRSTALIASRSS